jgi:S1-C subfamily serine protease
MPVMLKTTASLHPGANGGAVVNSDDQFVALITRRCIHPEVKIY